MTRNIFLFLSLALLLCACGSNGGALEKLHGNWFIDREKTIEMSEEYGKMSADMRKEFSNRIYPVTIGFDVFSKEMKVYMHKEHKDDGDLTPIAAMQFKVLDDNGDYIKICSTYDKKESLEIKFITDKEIIIKNKAKGARKLVAFDSLVMNKI